MSDFDFKNLEDLKAEEKRLHDEYNAKFTKQKNSKSKKNYLTKKFI